MNVFIGTKKSIKEIIKEVACVMITMVLVLSTVGEYRTVGVIKATEETYRVKELVEKRDEYSTTYLQSNGNEEIVVYSSPIRYKEGEELVDIDTSLEETNRKGYSYESKATVVSSYLPKQIGPESPVEVSYDKYNIKLYPITKEAAQKVRTKDKSTESLTLESAGKSSGRVSKEEIEDIYGNRSNKISKLTYDVYTREKLGNTNAIELEYIAENDGLIENIIINQNIGIYQFDFLLELSGCILETSDYGAIFIKDEETKEEVGL